jgi:hypothetical protein
MAGRQDHRRREFRHLMAVIVLLKTKAMASEKSYLPKRAGEG